MPARAAWNGEGRNSPRTASPLHQQSQAAPGAQADNYYEDIDPRFAGQPQTQQHLHPNEAAYDDIHHTNSGARSPAESERSTFTSISQRGVNPQWNPPPPMPQHRGPPRRPQQQRQDMILDNPDFQIPGGRNGGGNQRGAPGMVPGSAYPTGPI